MGDYFLTDQDAAALRGDHATLQKMAHPQAGGVDATTEADASGALAPDATVFALAQAEDYVTDSTNPELSGWGWHEAYWDEGWTAGGMGNPDIGTAKEGPGLALIVRTADGDGAPVNVLARLYVSFWAEIGDATPVEGASNQWTYDFTEKVRTTTGWTAPATPRTGSALNSIEANNDGVGVEGNSVDRSLTDYPAGFSYQPVKGHPIVRMWQEYADDDPTAPVYTFEYENADDGPCEVG